MKNIPYILFVLFAAMLLCGCAGMIDENNKQVTLLDQQMSADWLKAHIVVGKTTREEIRAWFGKRSRVASSL